MSNRVLETIIEYKENIYRTEFGSTFRENTVKVEAFVRTADDCKMTCSDNYLCGYYKHFPSDDDKQPLVIVLINSGDLSCL